MGLGSTLHGNSTWGTVKVLDLRRCVIYDISCEGENIFLYLWDEHERRLQLRQIQAYFMYMKVLVSTNKYRNKGK